MSTHSYDYIGIDVSKDRLDYALAGQKKSQQIHNQVSSIEKWLDKMDAAKVCLVLEPTGSYHDKLIQLADARGIAFVLVDPHRVHHYAKSEGCIHFNDRQAAQTLLRYAQEKQPSISTMPSEEKQYRKQLMSSLKALSKQRGMLQNQLHALEQLLRPNKVATESLLLTLETVEQQISRLQSELHDLEDEEEAAQSKLMQTVVGIGAKSADQILRYLGDFSSFDSPKQLLKFTGVVPAGHRSGTSVYKPQRITKKGPKSLRATLYMAAQSARKYNLACKELYDRMVLKGKPKKKAIVAVIAKLLRQVFAIVKSGKPFDNEYYLRFTQNS